LCETTIIQLSPFFHEKQHPKDIQSRGGKEYGKDQQIVVKQYSSENQDIDSGKENRK
jgi:isoprenylcysteine carboxyl methyltransferase (ICMT) family protein YpbQ